MNSSDLKRGAVISVNGAACFVERVAVQTPSSRGSNTLYKVRARNVKTKQKVDAVFKGGESIPEPQFERRGVQFLYKDTSLCHFMDLESYDQFSMVIEELEDELRYMYDNMDDLKALVVDDEVVAIELPLAVELEITECDPAVKGNSATARTKKAILQTGHAVQVPEHIAAGETVRVDTTTGKFVSRVSR